MPPGVEAYNRQTKVRLFRSINKKAMLGSVTEYRFFGKGEKISALL